MSKERDALNFRVDYEVRGKSQQVVVMSKERDSSNQSDTPPPGRRPPGTSLTLLQRLLDNEPEAWRTMVQLYTPLLCHWCARDGVRGADAEDVVQEVFRVAASRLATFRRDREGDSFRAWLRGITRNMLLVHFRRASRQPQGSGDSGVLAQLEAVVDSVATDSSEEDPPSELEALRRRALELVRGQVAERTWQAFWLTAIEGHDSAEVAANLGVSPTTVRMAKSRVLHRLKEQFGELIQ